MPPQYDSEGLAPFDSTWLAIASVRSVSIAYRRQSSDPIAISYCSYISNGHTFKTVCTIIEFFLLTYNSYPLPDLSFVV